MTSLVPLQRSDQLVTLWAETLAVAWAAAYADSDLEAGWGRSGTKRTRDVCSWTPSGHANWARRRPLSAVERTGAGQVRTFGVDPLPETA